MSFAEERKKFILLLKINRFRTFYGNISKLEFFKLNFFRTEKFTSYFSLLLVYFMYNLLPGTKLYVILQFVQEILLNAR